MRTRQCAYRDHLGACPNISTIAGYCGAHFDRERTEPSLLRWRSFLDEEQPEEPLWQKER